MTLIDPTLPLAQLIQLSVAPVFLLAGIGAILNAITGRLGRIVDRARQLEAGLSAMDDKQAELARTELGVLDRRMVAANRSISLAAGSAICVCLLVAILFVSDLLHINTEIAIVSLFVLAMGLLTAALLSFLAEVQLAAKTLRVRSELLRSGEPATGSH